MRRPMVRWAGLGCVFVLALASLNWEQGQGRRAPRWAVFMASVSIAAGVVVYAVALRGWLVGTGPLAEKLGDQLGALAGYVPELKFALALHQARVRDSPPNERDSRIRQALILLKSDWPRFAASYSVARYKHFRIGIVDMVFSIIVFFASMYLAALTLESGFRAENCRVSPAYQHASVERHGLAEMGLEAVYFSTVTFTTVGYGDLVPSESWIARVLAIGEALSFLFMIGVGLSFGLTTLTMTPMLTWEEARLLIKEDLLMRVVVRGGPSSGS